MTKRIISNIILTLTFIEGFLVSGVIIARRYPDGGYFLNTGFTEKNILMLSFSILVTFISVSILILTNRNHGLLRQKNRKIQSTIIFLVYFFLLCVFIECVQDILYLFSPISKPDLVFIESKLLLYSLLPFLLWGILLCIQIFVLIMLFLPDGRKPKISLRNWNKSGIVLFLILVSMWLGLAFSDFGYIPGTGNMYRRIQYGRFLPLTNPLLGIQITFVALSLLLLKVIFDIIKQKKPAITKFLRHPAIISLVIWGGAFLLWNSIPLEQNYLVDFPNIPSDTIYPDSDSYYFAREANGFLITGEFNESTTHVIYSLFLSGLSLIAGNSYPALISLQLIFVAFVPVLLYHFTTKLHNELSGFLVSVLFIIRERNGMLLGTELAGTVPNVLMSENLALIGIIGFLYIVYLWIENPIEKKWFPAIAGGVLGISLLIRADFAATLLAVSAITLVLMRKQRKVWFKGMITMFLIVGVIIGPWMFRNWQRTGVVYLDKKGVMMARVTHYVEQIFEKEQESQTQINSNIEEITVDSRRFSSVLNHIGNNIHQSFLYLPNSYTPFAGLYNFLYDVVLTPNQGAKLNVLALEEENLNIYTRGSAYYWFDWDGKENSTSIIPVTISLILITSGAVYLSKKRSRPDLIFLSVLAAHSVIWAIPGFSGNRFLKSVDWVVLVIYGIGLSVFTRWLIQKLKTEKNILADLDNSDPIQVKDPSYNIHSSNRIMIAVVLFLVLVGWSPTLLEWVIPPKYSEHQISEIVESAQSSGDILNHCQTHDSSGREPRIFFGTAIYPRFYSVGENLDNDRRRFGQDLERARIAFSFFGSEDMGVVIHGITADDIFPHGKEMFIIGEVISDIFIAADCIMVIDDANEYQIIKSME